MTYPISFFIHTDQREVGFTPGQCWLGLLMRKCQSIACLETLSTQLHGWRGSSQEDPLQLSSFSVGKRKCQMEQANLSSFFPITSGQSSHKTRDILVLSTPGYFEISRGGHSQDQSVQRVSQWKKVGAPGRQSSMSKRDIKGSFKWKCEQCHPQTHII